MQALVRLKLKDITYHEADGADAGVLVPQLTQLTHLEISRICSMRYCMPDVQLSTLTNLLVRALHKVSKSFRPRECIIVGFLLRQELDEVILEVNRSIVLSTLQ